MPPPARLHATADLCAAARSGTVPVLAPHIMDSGSDPCLLRLLRLLRVSVCVAPLLSLCFQFLYPLEDDVKTKMLTVCTQVYYSTAASCK